MFTKRLVAVFVMFGALAVVSTAARPGFAEEKNIFDRLDDFGKSIFNGILPKKKDKSDEHRKVVPDRHHSANWQDFSDPGDQSGTARAGSVLTRERRQTADAGRSNMIRPQTKTEFMPPVVQREDIVEPRRVRRPLAGTSLLEDGSVPVQSLRNEPSRDRAADRPTRRSAPAVAAMPGAPVDKPLHKRLEGYRRSAFDSKQTKRTRPSQKTVQERYANPAPVTEVEPIVPHPTGRSLIARRAIPRSVYDQLPEPRTDDLQQIDRPKRETIVERVDDRFQERQIDEPAIRVDHQLPKNDGVLFAGKGPNLGIETLGPRTISVGRESKYEVIVANSGDVSAEGLTVFVTLPDWAEVVGVETVTGAAQAGTDQHQAKVVRWTVGSLDAKNRAALTLKIIPRQPRPFDLEIGWDYKPVASQASIEVQEPKLALKLVGPNEVFYGKKELFKLVLSNAGTGDAENVELSLMPIGTGENVQASHKVGVLKAGGTKTLEVELTARQSGNLTIQVEARGEGDLKAELSEKVLVRRGDLKIGLQGPKFQFVGTVGEYTATVGNQGNAPAKNIFIALTLPAGAEYLSGVEGARPTEDGKRLIWRLETLPAGEELTFAVKCRTDKPGVSQVKLEAVADDDLEVSAETTAKVEAVADLTMKVKDPVGPIPIGKEVVYEVRVRNRGTATARRVEVFAYFSRGIEPLKAEGAESRIAPGQVIFQPIDSLGPNEEVVFKIRARANAAGNHVFRAETHCKPLGARLISEATNRYYGDVHAAEQMATRPENDEATR